MARASRLLPRPSVVAALAVSLIVEGLIVARAVPSGVAVGPDSVDFLRVSRQPLLSGEFWASTRAPVFPLLLRLVGGQVHGVRVAHVLIAAIAWPVLAFVLASRMGTAPGRVVTFAGVLLLSATVQVTIWDGMAMAESLSMSLLAIGLAVVVVVAGRWSWRGIAALSVIGILVVFVRDTNALVALAGAAAIVIGAVLRRIPVRALAAALVLVLASGAAMSTSSQGDRWLQSLHQVVRDRVLTSPSATKWFEDRGLPDAALVRSPAGDDFSRYRDVDRHGDFWRDPRFREYRSWLRAHGRATLLTYVMHDPGFLGRGPFAAPSSWAGPTPSVREYQKYLGTRPALGHVGNAIIWPESPWVVFPLEALAVLVAAAVLLTDRERRAISAVAIASVGLGMVLVVVAANLATAETPRHAIVPMAMARIGILCGLVCGVESVVVRARSRGVARQPRQAVRDAAILTTL